MQVPPDGPKGDDARDESPISDAAIADARVNDATGAAADTKEETSQRDAEAGTVAQIAPPRLIAPLSTSTATSQRPTLRWSLAAGTDGAFVQICRDRSCASPVTTLELDGAKGAPAANLTKGIYFWRAFGRRGGVKGTVASATWQFTVGARSAPVDTSWGSTLDVNGDGFADVIIGAYDGDNIGYVYLYYGGATGLLTTPSVTLVNPRRVFDYFGITVASAGDVNGDGYGDVLVGASAPAVGGSDGQAYIYFGGPSGLSPSPATTLHCPLQGFCNFGATVAGAGDMNGDGYADIVVASLNTLDTTDLDHPYVTRVHLFFGGPSGPSDGAAATVVVDPKDGGYGPSVNAGDVNGDGYSDLLVGTPWADNGVGRANVYFGGASGISSTSRLVLQPPDPGLYPPSGTFGVAVAGEGDVNGDGYADVVVGAHFSSSGADGGSSLPGRIYVYLGGASGPPAVPSMKIDGTDSELLGFGLASAGDVNGDGYSDIVAGATGQYRVHVYYGSSSGLLTAPIATMIGPPAPPRLLLFVRWLRGRRR